MIYILRCSFCPPTFCKQIQCFFLKKKKAIKGEKNTRKLKTISPKLTYKDWNFFFPLPPSYLESQSTWTLKTYKKEGFLFSRDTLKLTIPLPRHCTWLNQHTSFSFKNNTSHQKKKENKKNPSAFFFCLILDYVIIAVYVCLLLPWTHSTQRGFTTRIDRSGGASYDCATYGMLQKITRLPQSLSCK